MQPAPQKHWQGLFWVDQQEASSRLCRLLKDFEREARTDGMPAPLLAERKKALADELNDFIKKKKEIGAFAERSELLEGATGPPQEDNLESRWLGPHFMGYNRHCLGDTGDGG
jgi:hypothetical protein